MTKMTSFLFSRWVSFIALLVCLGVLGFAAYLQIQEGLLPCPLCVLQRIMFAVIGLVLLPSSLYTPIKRSGKRFHSIIMLLVSSVGMLIAGRHVWVTLQPPGAMATCSPTLDYMLKNLPLNQTLKLMFQGSDDCARITWVFLKLSIPEWSFIVFTGFAVFGLLRYIFAQSEKGL